ncbi:hypothetical protein GSI_08775 [Ganoderma sinense ZZ0214-1]|uniref:Uncharacterized protein n=1 Tax=Ganoderma sinense ZZ0214-1 TaxID=1077348 RepID=A0A2G8S4Q4_9APHY|nr:hypothetical protein GSI_08775 [Ganoderma sinense ZZ0214-1]
MPSYTRSDGYRNLAAHYPEHSDKRPTFKPDLGPKMYIATKDIDSPPVPPPSKAVLTGKCMPEKTHLSFESTSKNLATASLAIPSTLEVST